MSLAAPMPEWMDDGLCAQVDGELFWPEQGASARDAKKVCAACDVRLECLAYALEHDERFGIWGGTTEQERRRMQGRNVRVQRKPTCVNGHKFTDENTYVTAKGWRKCRRCAADRQAERKAWLDKEKSA